MYKGKDIGTATIFQDDVRISTNVLTEQGTRAIGTRVAEDVYNLVVENGLPWVDRAYVVNDWYITAYEPIRNIFQHCDWDLLCGHPGTKIHRPKAKCGLDFHANILGWCSGLNCYLLHDLTQHTNPGSKTRLCFKGIGKW